MLVYKQRYKPRTSRAFTKSDLTVYDSAGNTALNALTVYGKSEVVDGSIVSAGEGWSVVDLGTLPWQYDTSSNPPRFYTDINTLAGNDSPLMCSVYLPKTDRTYIDGDMQITRWNTTGSKTILITNSNYTDTATFKTAMSGVLLCYQLADPTQGNAIAIKTDDGSGIDGTMATFSTGTPLHGIPETTVRDVMEWDGTSGEVTKNCGEVDLGTLTWYYRSEYTDFMTDGTSLFEINSKHPSRTEMPKCIVEGGYTFKTWNAPQFNMSIAQFADGRLSIQNTDYTDATAFTNSLNGVMLVYELATPTTQALTSTENTSIAGLRTFAPNTHAQNNAGTDMTVDYTIRVPTV